jgi:ketosteroid isomerase-like protein
MTTTTARTGELPTLIRDFLDATERGDIEALVELVHPDVNVEWPQSGERFTGQDNALAAQLATPIKPEVAGEPVVIGGGDVWVIRMPLRYGPDTFHYAGIFEIEDGKIRRTTEYFAAPFPANEARARYADR